MKNYNENESYREPEIDLNTGDVIYNKPQTKKFPNSKVVFSLFGKYPANWNINRTQLLAAENLFAERGVEKILKALHYAKTHRSEEFCPIVDSPYDLDSKWAKLAHFRQKHE